MKRSGLLIGLILLSLTTIQAQTPEADTAPPAAPPAAAPPTLSPGAAEVVRLAGAGTGDDVVLAYIQNSTGSFDLTADQILYLRDLGISAPVITAMLNRDNALKNLPQSEPKPAPTLAPPPAAGTAVQPQVQPPPQTAPVEAPLVPQTPVEAPAPVYVSTPPADVGYFYDNLSPYGTWVQLDGVGWCWQPRVVVINHAWRPYCDSGHWVYTDAGWFWQSDYSWGWAAFHYGRWHLHERCGWVWMPDRVWGPAWVTWRSEGDHCGWAPLPPHAEFDVRFGYRFNGVHVGLNFDFGLRPDHFTFIALRDFHEHDFAHHRLPPTEVTRIYNHTTIINNYVVKNNTVVNQGLKVDRVSAATHTEFRKVAIRDVPAGSSTSVRGSVRTESVVYRPQLQAPPKTEKIVAQKVDDRHPVIQHAPVVAARTERPLVAGPTTSGNRGYQSGVGSRPNMDRAPAYQQQQQQPTPKLNRPGPTSTTTSSAPSSHNEQERSVTGRGPNQGNPQYPLRSGTPPPSNTYRPPAQTQNPRVYPKGNSQSSDGRSGSSGNSRSGDYRNPQSSDKGNGSGRGSGGPSKRNDQ